MRKQFTLVVMLFSFFIALVLPQQSTQGRFSVNDDVNNHLIEEICPPIQNTPFFTFAYGSVILNSVSAPVGSLVKAISPRGDIVGCFAVTTTGNYGAMYIYGEDNTVVPPIPGMRNNEPVTFTIEGVPAESTPILLWTNDKDLHQVNLASMGVSADFSATPRSGVFPLSVQFTDNSSGSIISRLWNFGDGQTSNATNPLHTYNTPGMYTVSLTVSGDTGSDIETKANYISVYTTVNANFSVNQTSGIAPLSVTFTNSSSGDYYTSSWSFGDGGTSTASNPTHIYTSGGIYSVSLTVSGPGGTDTETKTNYITVYNPVNANFSANPTSGIAPLTVAFTNTSTGDYSSLLWNFGDGATSNLTNPSHTYNSSGEYTVTLTASGLGGSDLHTSVINVYDAVIANFSASPTSGIAPISVTFTNLSTGDFTTSFWNFGDGSSSSETNPIHNYTLGGIYTVSLTVSGLGGIDEEVHTGYITVYTPSQAQFSGTPTIGVLPLTVNFTNHSSGDFNSQSWTFGDGGSSTELNPSYIYTSEGSYSVSLTVEGLGGTAVETKTNYITVYSPVSADFTATPTNGISPLLVSFTNQSTGSYDGFTWDFGDGNISSEVNPTHLYSDHGVYTVTLTASGPGGTDVETKTSYITVYQPVIADFIVDLTSGIAPFDVSFTNLSTGDYSNLLWDFGDSSTSTSINPIHEYTLPGTYTVSLTASGLGGSDTETKSAYVTVHQPVVADFAGTPLEGIAPMTVAFTNLSTGDFDSFLWDFGEGGTGTEQNPIYLYSTPGIYSVSLTVSGNGGTDTEIKTDYITIYEPVAIDFFANPISGIAPFVTTFTSNISGDYDTILWDFGDGSTSSNPNPTHEYLLPGIYSVSLTVSGSGGTDVETKTDYITVYQAVSADFSADPLNGIAPITVFFTNSSTGDFTTQTWQFGDGQTSDLSNPSHEYAAAGVYTVTLTVSGLGGSDDEIKTDYITVYEPVQADFIYAPSSGPAPLTVNFTNASSGDFATVAWVFGDGGTSTLENPTHIYETPGVYSISLTVSGNGGEDTETKTDVITVYVPVVASFTSDVTEGIAPLTVHFTDTSTGSPTTWLWDFGDGSTSIEQNPMHEFVSGGIYNVSLTVTGLGGTDSYLSYIIVYTPVEAAFEADPVSGYSPLIVQFINQSTGDYNLLEWDFGDGSPTSNETNPIHTYHDLGIYIITLTATGLGGNDAFQVEVHVYPYLIYLPMTMR